MPTYKQQEPQASPITPGKHKVEIEGAELKISDRTGNEYIRLKCRVKLPDGSNGGTIYDNMVFTAKSAWKIDQIREALGFAIIPNEDASVEPEHLVGRTGTVIVEHNDDTGYHEIASWVSPKSSAPAPKAKPAKETDDIPF